MANLSTYLEEALLGHILKNTSYTSPTTVYVGIVDDTAVDDDMEAGTVTNEITAYDGNRKEITFGTITQAGGKSLCSNTGAITFANMPVVTVKYAIICDHATAGNVLTWVELTPNRDILVAGDSLVFPIGDIVVNMD